MKSKLEHMGAEMVPALYRVAFEYSFKRYQYQAGIQKDSEKTMRPGNYSRSLLSSIFYHCSHEAVKPSKPTNHPYLRRDVVLIAGTAGESTADMVC